MRGQVFSLDFIIALILVCACIGGLLHFYETTAYSRNENFVQGELNIIAINASELVLANRCSPDSALAQKGYELVGCSDPDSVSITKAGLMIPNGFECYITINGVAQGECTAAPPQTARDVAAVERQFLEGPAVLSKTAYEGCLAGAGCTAYDEKQLAVKIWK